MQQFKYFLVAVLTLVLLPLLIIVLVIGRQVIITSAPILVVIFEIALVYVLVAGLVGLTWHFIKKGKLEAERAKLEAERYRFQTRKLDPIGANYPVIYENGTLLQAQPGILAQPVPHSLTYSPHITVKSEAQSDTFDADETALEPVLPRAVPFYRIIEEVAPHHLCLGVACTGPLFGSMDDLLSTAIVGRPGTGKTTLLRFVSAQVLRVGGTPLLWDPQVTLLMNWAMY
jgi:hypothetical protein